MSAEFEGSLNELAAMAVAKGPALGDALGARSSRNRRAQARSPFECVQLVAPYDGEHLPTQADFQHVVCRDLSTSGISFVVPHRLPTARVIVALGTIPFSFVVAEAVRSELTDDGDVLVGCRFIERLGEH